MIELTPQGQAVRDEYLRQVRAYVSVSGAADAEDVLRDVEEHLQRELQAASQPVPAEEVRKVLTRLGSPSQWVSPDGLSWWRRIVLRARVGPDDWRLAYATFGLLLLGVLSGWIFCDTDRWSGRHEFNGGALALFAAISFFPARAALAAPSASGGLTDAQKWLVYPSLAMACMVFGAALLCWAPLAAGGAAYGLTEHFFRHHSPPITPHFIDIPYPDARAAIFAAVPAGAAVGGLWWIVLSLLLRGRTGALVQSLFRPFLDRRLPQVRKAALIIGVVVFLLGAGASVACIILAT